jgi:hypothetical protein
VSDLAVFQVSTDTLRLGEDYDDQLVILAADEEGGVVVVIAQGKQRIQFPASLLPDLYLKAMRACEFAGYRSDA